MVEVMELSEETELAAARRGFVPFGDAAGGVFMESDEVSAPFALTPGEVGAEGEEGLGVSDNLETPGWMGGRGARYLTLAGCD